MLDFKASKDLLTFGARECGGEMYKGTASLKPQSFRL